MIVSDKARLLLWDLLDELCLGNRIVDTACTFCGRDKQIKQMRVRNIDIFDHRIPICSGCSQSLSLAVYHVETKKTYGCTRQANKGKMLRFVATRLTSLTDEELESVTVEWIARKLANAARIRLDK